MGNRQILIAAALSAVSLIEASTSWAQPAVKLAPFSSVEVRNGGHVMLKSGPAHRVTIVRGSAEHVRMTVSPSGVLTIDNCPGKCPRRQQMEIEVVAPAFTRVSLAHGGRVWTTGAFPRQAELTASVSNGGTVDVRSIPADRVNASVEQGGRVLTIPRASLLASVSNGGVVTWWGNPQVRQSVEHGGVIQRGEASEMNAPHSEVGLPLMHRSRKHE